MRQCKFTETGTIKLLLPFIIELWMQCFISTRFKLSLILVIRIESKAVHEGSAARPTPFIFANRNCPIEQRSKIIA